MFQFHWICELLVTTDCADMPADGCVPESQSAPVNPGHVPLAIELIDLSGFVNTNSRMQYAQVLCRRFTTGVGGHFSIAIKHPFFYSLPGQVERVRFLKHICRG